MQRSGWTPARAQGKADELLHELDLRGQAPVGREQAPLVMSTALKVYLKEKEREKLYRQDSPFRRYVRMVTETNAFNYTIMALVMANVVVVAFDDHTKPYAYLDLIFFAFFSLELVMKYYALRQLYWNSSYNIMDFCLVAISLFQLLLQTYLPYLNITYLRVIRALRALKALRSISLFRSLQVIISALWQTIRTSVIDVLLLMMLVVFLFANIGYHFFYMEVPVDGIVSNFQDLGTAMFTLFVFITADGWTDRQSPLDQLGFTYNRVYVAFFIFIGNFVLYNLFVAVICKNIDDAQEADRKVQRRLRLEAKKYKRDIVSRKQQGDLDLLMTNQRKLHETTDFQAFFKNLAGQLHHDDITMTSQMCCHVQWMQTYQMSLKYHEQSVMRCQQAHGLVAQCLTDLVALGQQGNYADDKTHEADVY